MNETLLYIVLGLINLTLLINLIGTFYNNRELKKEIEKLKRGKN